MPLRDGKPTCHEQRVAELCERDPEFEQAYVHFMAEIDAEQVDDLGDPIDDDLGDDRE